MPSASPSEDENAVVGVLSLNERQAGEGFTHSSLDFLGPVALQIGMALTRARLYEKITREKEKSTAIVESMGESLCVRAPDRTILFANSAHKEIFGEDCEGKPLLRGLRRPRQGLPRLPPRPLLRDRGDGAPLSFRSGPDGHPAPAGDNGLTAA